MRIVIHMGDKYPKESPSAKRVGAFYDMLRARGHHVSILAPFYESCPIGEVDVYYCRTFSLKSKSPANRLANQIGFGFSSFFKSLSLGKADIVITTSPPALASPFGWLIAKCKRARLVYDVRDIWPDVAWEMGSFKPQSLYSRVFGAVRDFMLRHADLVTAVSNGKVEKLQTYAPDSDIIMITNGLDEKFLKNAENKGLIKHYGIGKKFTCVYIGNLGLAQGLMQLLRLAKKVKEEGIESQFLLFGTGVEESRLKQYAEEEHLTHVLFPGRLPNDDIFTILKYADMSFVSLANDRLKDSVPTKMFEALGAGCPVLLAAKGEAVDILEECGLGVAVSPNDDEALWEGFLKIRMDKQEITKNRARAYRLMKTKYSRQQAALQLTEELENRFSCIEKPQHGSYMDA